MNVVPASFQIEERSEYRGSLDVIERAGRTCYKSEDKACMGNGDKFVTSLIKNGHEAMLEHGDYIFMVDDESVWDNVFSYLKLIREMTGRSPMIEMTNVNHRRIISGNIRAWRELILFSSAGCYFSGLIDPIYTNDLKEKLKAWFTPEPDSRVHQIYYSELNGQIEKLTHQRKTVRLIVDRGVSHEIVRHRLFSFAQESTRYCNYSKDKFGNQITVIEPCYWKRGTAEYDTWLTAMSFAEHQYFALLNNGASPQEARAVLPSSLKTELVVTGNLSEWRHFFDLRARQITGKAHPQIVEVALPLYEAFEAMEPEAFEF